MSFPCGQSTSAQTQKQTAQFSSCSYILSQPSVLCSTTVRNGNDWINFKNIIQKGSDYSIYCTYSSSSSSIHCNNKGTRTKRRILLQTIVRMFSLECKIGSKSVRHINNGTFYNVHSPHPENITKTNVAIKSKQDAL